MVFWRDVPQPRVPSRHSCESLLILTTHDFLVRMDRKGEGADILVLDFSKAFNTVPHKRLLHKLEFYGKKQNPGSPNGPPNYKVGGWVASHNTG